MNLLYEHAPEYVVVRGRKIPVRTEFGAWVRLLCADKPEEIAAAVDGIFCNALPDDVTGDEVAQAIVGWLLCGTEPERAERRGGGRAKRAYDFREDGNVIFCELWEHFPTLMQKGIDFHTGRELVNMLICTEGTSMHHRAFARCGDFSGLDKERRKYWAAERRRLKLADRRTSEEMDDDLDRAIAKMF